MKDYIKEYKMAAIGFIKYYIPSYVDDPFWPNMECSYEEADGPFEGITAAGKEFELNRMSFMAQAAKKVEVELKAAEGSKQPSADGGKAKSDAAEKPPASKKKKRVVVDQGKMTLAEVGMQPSKVVKESKKNVSLSTVVQVLERDFKMLTSSWMT